jgi:hypothetical protein
MKKMDEESKQACAEKTGPEKKREEKKPPGRWATDGERKKRTDRVGSGRGGGKKPGPNTSDIVQVGWLGYGIIFHTQGME